MYAWILIKARISADTIGRYIGHDKSISAYRLSVKFHRYANPASHGCGSNWLSSIISGPPLFIWALSPKLLDMLHPLFVMRFLKSTFDGEKSKVVIFILSITSFLLVFHQQISSSDSWTLLCLSSTNHSSLLSEHRALWLEASHDTSDKWTLQFTGLHQKRAHTSLGSSCPQCVHQILLLSAHACMHFYQSKKHQLSTSTGVHPFDV